MIRLRTPPGAHDFIYDSTKSKRFAGLVAKRDNGAASRQFVYGYETNSALVKSLAVVSNAFFVTRDFEANRDLLTNVETKWSTTTRTKFAYAYDDRRLRQSVVQSGDVFSDYGGTDSGAIHQIFTYNARGEVTAGATFLGATATDQSTPLSARKHEFDYDGIGNRKWSNTSGSSGLKDNYTVNELNQYTGRENNTLALGGVADTDALVAARSSALAGRAGKHWGDNITVENWLAPFSGNLKVYAVKPGTGGAAYARQTIERTAFLPPAAQSFAYDADGNLTNDGVWAYSWDAENRLTAMETTAGAVMGGMTAQRLEFKYDYMNRRVEKLVRGGWNGTTYATITAQRRYLYDGWSLLAEFSVSGTTLTKVRTYAWGLDIARSMKDAGGVGALLQIRDHASGKDYFPSYDGNGNIAALFDASDGTVGAAYEYSPYGEFLRCEGTYAKENPFRFSTKFTDDETGLVYYGRRYYDPSNGRFVGRDPKMEKGGLNLYGFCGNDGVNRWDYLGMDPGYPPSYAGEIATVLEVVGQFSDGSLLRNYVTYRAVRLADMNNQENGSADDDLIWVPDLSGNRDTPARDMSRDVPPKFLGEITVYVPPVKYKKGDTWTDPESGRKYTITDGGAVTVRLPFTGPNASDRAAVSILQQINTVSIQRNIEFSGIIQKNNVSGVVTATQPITIGVSDTTGVYTFGDVGLLDTAVGIFHTHGAAELWSDELFSSTDIQYSRGKNLPSYVATPGGAIYRYDPGSDSLALYDATTSGFSTVSATWNSELGTWIPSGVAPPPPPP